MGIRQKVYFIKRNSSATEEVAEPHFVRLIQKAQDREASQGDLFIGFIYDLRESITTPKYAALSTELFEYYDFTSKWISDTGKINEVIDKLDVTPMHTLLESVDKIVNENHAMLKQIFNKTHEEDKLLQPLQELPKVGSPAHLLMEMDLKLTRR